MPEAQWDWHVGWALICVRFPRLRPPGCCGRGSTRSRSTARRRGRSVTRRTTAPCSGSRSWLISAHGNWLPWPKAQARRRKHPPGPPPAAGRPGERERLVAEFYRSPEGRALTGVVARFLPRDLVAFCADYLGRDPLRPGPLLFRRLLRDVLPMQLVLPARLAGEVAPVILAWAAWTADRASLPKRLRRRLLSELDGELREFPAVLAAASQQPHNRYFQDLPDDVISDDTRCQQALQRRHLAVPLYHDRAEDTGTLDAAGPSGRAKITELWLARTRNPARQAGVLPGCRRGKRCGQASRRK